MTLPNKEHQRLQQLRARAGTLIEADETYTKLRAELNEAKRRHAEAIQKAESELQGMVDTLTYPVSDLRQKIISADAMARGDHNVNHEIVVAIELERCASLPRLEAYLERLRYLIILGKQHTEKDILEIQRKKDPSYNKQECPHGHEDWDDCPDCRH